MAMASPGCSSMMAGRQVSASALPASEASTVHVGLPVRNQVTQVTVTETDANITKLPLRQMVWIRKYWGI